MFFCLNDTATTEIYALALHDSRPISPRGELTQVGCPAPRPGPGAAPPHPAGQQPSAGRDEEVLAGQARG